MESSGIHPKGGIDESAETHPMKTSASSTSAPADHSFPAATGKSPSAADDNPVSASSENTESAPPGSFSDESRSDERTFPFDPDCISCYLPYIFELPGESSFEAALSSVRLPDIECGQPFGLVIRLSTPNNFFKTSVRLTGEPTIIDADNNPDVFIRKYSYPEGDSVCIWGTASRPNLLEIAIPYAIQDPRREEPVSGKGKVSLSITDPAFPAEVEKAYRENTGKSGGLEKSPSLPRWGREGEQYEGECDISEFLSPGSGELKLRSCLVLYKDSKRPAAGMKTSIDFESGTLQLSGVPASPGPLMFRFLYSNGQQADMTDDDAIIEIISSSFFDAIEDVVESVQKIPPKQSMAGTFTKYEIALPDSFDPDRMAIGDLVVSVPDLNAVYDREKKTVKIEGTPDRSGVVTLTFALLAKTELGHEITETVNVPVLELCSDTRSRWKNLPTDSTAPYQTPDEEHVFIKAGSRTILAASKRGRTHAHRGKFRDDNFKACYIKETGWFVVAVSDGAGSARYSREGSRIICDAFCLTMHRILSSGELVDPGSADLEKDLRSAVLNAARQGLELIMAEAGSMSRTDPDVTVIDYSATLLGYVMKQFEDGWLIVSIGIGDGVIGLLDNSGQHILLSCPDHGEFPGQTRFLTTSDVWLEDPISRTSAVKIRDFKAVFTMSDGVSDPKFETENDMNNPQFWGSLWDEISSQVPLEERSEEIAGKLSEWLDFVSRGYNDDRTIVLVY